MRKKKIFQKIEKQIESYPQAFSWNLRCVNKASKNITDKQLTDLISMMKRNINTAQRENYITDKQKSELLMAIKGIKTKPAPSRQYLHKCFEELTDLYDNLGRFLKHKDEIIRISGISVEKIPKNAEHELKMIRNDNMYIIENLYAIKRNMEAIINQTKDIMKNKKHDLPLPVETMNLMYSFYKLLFGKTFLIARKNIIDVLEEENKILSEEYSAKNTEKIAAKFWKKESQMIDILNEADRTALKAVSTRLLLAASYRKPQVSQVQQTVQANQDVFKDVVKETKNFKRGLISSSTLIKVGVGSLILIAFLGNALIKPYIAQAQEIPIYPYNPDEAKIVQDSGLIDGNKTTMSQLQKIALEESAVKIKEEPIKQAVKSDLDTTQSKVEKILEILEYEKFKDNDPFHLPYYLASLIEKKEIDLKKVQSVVDELKSLGFEDTQPISKIHLIEGQLHDQKSRISITKAVKTLLKTGWTPEEKNALSDGDVHTILVFSTSYVDLRALFLSTMERSYWVHLDNLSDTKDYENINAKEVEADRFIEIVEKLKALGYKGTKGFLDIERIIILGKLPGDVLGAIDYLEKTDYKLHGGEYLDNQDLKIINDTATYFKDGAIPDAKNINPDKVKENRVKIAQKIKESYKGDRYMDRSLKNHPFINYLAHIKGDVIKAIETLQTMRFPLGHDEASNHDFVKAVSEITSSGIDMEKYVEVVDAFKSMDSRYQGAMGLYDFRVVDYLLKNFEDVSEGIKVLNELGYKFRGNLYHFGKPSERPDLPKETRDYYKSKDYLVGNKDTFTIWLLLKDVQKNEVDKYKFLNEVKKKMLAKGEKKNDKKTQIMYGLKVDLNKLSEIVKVLKSFGVKLIEKKWGNMCIYKIRTLTQLDTDVREDVDIIEAIKSYYSGDLRTFTDDDVKKIVKKAYELKNKKLSDKEIDKIINRH